MSTPFYDLASLVVVPSGYKASKVYAQKPLTTDGQLSFSRSTGATRVASNGLIEKVRTNLALYSQDFSQTGTWVTSTTTRVDSQTDPSGGTTASKFTATGANSNVIQTRTVSSGIPYTWSFYAKSDSATGVNIRLDNGNGNFVQTNMALTTSWQRFSITLNSNATTIQCYLGGGLSFTAGEVVYMAFAQLEVGDVMTDYIPTTTAAVSVGPVANVPRLDYLNSSCPRLLLEPQRTNLVTFSEQIDNAAWTTNATGVTISANTTKAPDGTSSADAILATTTNSGHQVQQRNLSVTSGTTYTISCYLKKNGYRYAAIGVAVNLAAEVVVDFDSGTATGGTLIEMANGWYRLVATATASATGLTRFSIALRDDSNNSSFVGDVTKGVYAWGAQLEAGAYATSYIGPTLGAAVTRGADAASKTGISSLIGQTEGTLFCDFDMTQTSETQTVISVADGTSTSDFVLVYKLNNNILSARIRVGGVDQPLIGSPVLASGRHKLAFAYKQNDLAFYVDGVLIGTSSSANIPSVLSKLSLNEIGAGINQMFSGTRQALLFKTRLTNAQLAELTTL